MCFWFVRRFFQRIQPALRTTASPRNRARRVQLIRFRVFSALLALVNIDPPLDASPPIPSPFGLWSSTLTMSSKPLATQIQESTEASMNLVVRGCFASPVSLIIEPTGGAVSGFFRKPRRASNGSHGLQGQRCVTGPAIRLPSLGRSGWVWPPARWVRSASGPSS